MENLSFYLTVRNGISYIEHSLGSILRFYPNSKIVVVDDGSTDGTTALLRRFQEENRMISIIFTEGVGRGAALNIALKETNTRFVANMDADDIALPGREILIEQMSVAPTSNIGAISGKTIIIDEDFQPGDVDKLLPGLHQHNRMSNSCRSVHNELYRANPLSHIGVVLDRDKVVAIGGYDEERTTQLDFDLWLRLAKAGYQLMKSEVIVGAKRLHSEQQFEHRNHLRYVINSNKLRVSAANSPIQRVVAKGLSVARITWALIPRSIRSSIQKARGGTKYRE